MIDHLLDTDATVYRQTLAADGRGGRSAAFASVGSVRAKVNQPSAAEQLEAGQGGADIITSIHVAYTADVRRGDELDTGGARRLRVVAVVSNSRLTYKRCDCEVNQGGA